MYSGNLQNVKNTNRVSQKHRKHKNNFIFQLDAMAMSSYFPSIFLCNSTQQPSLGLENPSYCNPTFQPTVDRQGNNHIYFVLSRTDRQSVELTEYANMNKPKKQMILSKGQLSQKENLNASLNQEFQELSRSGEVEHIYDQPVLPKKEFPPQTSNRSDNMGSSQNGDPKELYPLEEGARDYDQPVLPQKELPPQAINGTDNMDSSPNGESRELSPSEEFKPVYIQPNMPKDKMKKHYSSLPNL